MQEKKKILFVINTMGRAGAEKVLTALLRQLDPDLVEVDLLSLIPRGEMYSRVPEFVNILNTEPIMASVLDKDGKKYVKRHVFKALLKKARFISYLPYALKNIKAQKKRGRVMPDKLFWKLISDSAPRFSKEYDLAVGYTEGASTYYVANYVFAKKKVSFIHVDFLTAGYIPALEKQYYDVMDNIFCVSIAVRQNFADLFPQYDEKTKVFNNIVTPEEIIGRCDEFDPYQDGFNGTRFLTVARLHFQKGLDIAIKTFAKLKKMGYNNIKWYVLGEGDERGNLESLISEHGLQDDFILFGASMNPYPYINGCDIYIQPSRFEGYCIALTEALILGKPAIVTDFAGARDQIIPGETGIITTLLNENLLNCIKNLLDNPEKKDKIIDNVKKRPIDVNKHLHYIYDLCDVHA